MKFSLIIAAAAGAIASPLAARHLPSVSAPSGPAHSVSSLPSHSHSVPSGPAHSISLPAFGTKSCGSKRHSITSIPSLAAAKPTGLPAAGGDDNDDSDVKPSSVSAFEHSHPSGLPVPEHEHPTPEVGEVCKKVTVTVIEIKELVAGDVEVIKSIFAVADPTKVDGKHLLSALETLKLHLQMILKLAVPKLLGLVFKIGGITTVDVEAVLELLEEIKLILVLVESCLGELVGSVSADVLKIVIVEIKLILKLLLLIAGPIIKFALGLLGAVKGIAGLVGGVTKVLGEIEGVEGAVGGVLTKLTAAVTL